MTKRTININQWSLAALQIEMFFDDTLLSHGTGSVWKKDGRAYLVTNWHNVTGRHHQTNKHLSSTLAEPNRLCVYLHSKFGPGLHEKFFMPLIDSDGNKLWMEHPSQGQIIDLIALPFEIPFDAMVTFVNELTSTPLVTMIGADLFVVGFPFKKDVVGCLPIWKRASLASEPNLELLTGQSRILVDTATRPGMSGSLVFRQQTGNWQTEDGNAIISGGGVATRLLGIYSGRLGANRDGDAQLGIVWPTMYVEELLEQASKN